MNVTLEDAEMIDPSGAKLNFSSFFVQNRLIRYVQIPEYLDIRTLLTDQTRALTGQSRGPGIGRGKISKQRQKILDKRENQQQEDIRNALKMREEMKKSMKS